MKYKKTIGLFILAIFTNILYPVCTSANSLEVYESYKETSILEETNKDIETYYIDLDQDGISEIVEIAREATRQAYINYYVYDSTGQEMIFSREDIYRGVIELTSHTIIEKIPIFKGEEFDDEIDFYENEYILIDGEIICINSRITKHQENQVKAYSTQYYPNPSRQELEDMLEEVALDKGIPPSILKAIAYTESNYRQFKDGQPLLSFDGVSFGIMQVTPKFYPELDIQRLKYDTRYNIESGANILLGKWGYAFSKNPLIPKIGDADPRILENWYFAIWAYNGLSESNNPNLMPYKHKTWIQYEAYQDKVIRHAREILNQDIIPIPKQLIPSKGKPDPNIDYTQIKNSKADKYRLFVENQIVKVNSSNGVNLRNNNMEFIKSIKDGSNLRIQARPKLYDGYWRYRVEELYDDGSVKQTGWVAANWIVSDDKSNRSFQVWQKKTIRDRDYTWTIKFNLPVDTKFIADTIYIEDSRSNKIAVRVNYDRDNYNVLKIKADDLYRVGEVYTLYIKGVKTFGGSLLKENIQMDFII